MRRSVVVLVAATLLVAAGLSSPGFLYQPEGLHASHDTEDSRCRDCHTATLAVSSARCSKCHSDGAPSGVPQPEELHGSLAGHECSACHTEHLGPHGDLTREGFDHKALDAAACAPCHPAPEDPIHAALTHDCAACHEATAWRPATFDHSSTGDAACSSCHLAPDDELHAAGADDCAACHRPDAWRPATFDHDRFFRFDRHHGPGCPECHPTAFDSYDCYGCHEHSRRGVAAEHREEGIRDFEACTECHRSGDEDEAERLWRGQGRERERDHDDEEHEHRRGHDRDDD